MGASTAVTPIAVVAVTLIHDGGCVAGINCTGAASNTAAALCVSADIVVALIDVLKMCRIHKR